MRKPLVIIFGIMSAVMLLAIACGSDEANPDATATTAPPPTVLAGQITPEPTAAPTAVPPHQSSGVHGRRRWPNGYSHRC